MDLAQVHPYLLFLAAGFFSPWYAFLGCSPAQNILKASFSLDQISSSAVIKKCELSSPFCHCYFIM